jgi:hypothetical protein
MARFGEMPTLESVGSALWIFAEVDEVLDSGRKAFRIVFASMMRGFVYEQAVESK